MTHDRREAHFGTQLDTTITTTEALGPLPVGSTLAEVLAFLYGNATSLSDYPFFSLAAFIAPYFGLNAVISDEQVDSFGLDAWINQGASFGLDAVVHGGWNLSFGVGAYIAPSPEPWNVVRTPRGGTANYTAISFSGNDPPDAAADGMRYHDFAGDAWTKGASGAVGDWWQVTWAAPQTVDRIVLIDGSVQSDGTPFTSGRFGNTGTIEFSDGSSVPYSGLNDTVLTVTFSGRTVSWFRVVSGVAGGSSCGLAEVEAYDTNQWED